MVNAEHACTPRGSVDSAAYRIRAPPPPGRMHRTVVHGTMSHIHTWYIWHIWVCTTYCCRKVGEITKRAGPVREAIRALLGSEEWAAATPSGRGLSAKSLKARMELFRRAMSEAMSAEPT